MITPMEQSERLAKIAGVRALFLKREDLTPTGSFKFRSAVRQIEHLIESGKKEGVVSSSGNAAISLAREAKAQGIKLYTFISPEMSSGKLSALLSHNPIAIESKRAMRLANYMSAKFRMINLRPSIDDHAVQGFASLGEEIEEQMREHGGANAIASFMTSGASMLGIVKGYGSNRLPRCIAVMSKFAGALGTSRSPRLEEVKRVAEVVEVSQEDISFAGAELNRAGFHVAEEAVASFAAIIKLKPDGNVVWVVSGRDWGASSGCAVRERKIYKAETFEDVDKIYAQTRI
jgi:threonine dehydratase